MTICRLNEAPYNQFIYTNVLLVMWGTNTMKEFLFSEFFFGKKYHFCRFQKNFVVDCFWGRTWAGSTISHQNITFTQGFWLLKEFWWSDFFLRKNSSFCKIGYFLDLEFLMGWKSKVILCVLFIHQRIAGDVRN